MSLTPATTPLWAASPARAGSVGPNWWSGSSRRMRSRTRFMARRIYIELKEQGVVVSLNTVAKYMRQEQIRSKVKRPFRFLTTDSDHAFPVARNLLERNFEAAAPNRKWCCDITHVATDEGPLYVAVVI